MKGKFYFIINKPHFVNYTTNEDGHLFTFSDSNQDKELFGVLCIPFKKEQNIRYEVFIQINEEPIKSIDEIELTPKWFQEIYKKVYDNHERKRRLWKLVKSDENIPR